MEGGKEAFPTIRAVPLVFSMIESLIDGQLLLEQALRSSSS